MIERRFHPPYRFALPAVALGSAIGLGLGVLDDLRSNPDFDVVNAIAGSLFTAIATVMPGLFAARWYSKVLVTNESISARDTLGRWRTIPWDSVSAVRKVRILGLTYVVVSSPKSRWSIWLAQSLEPRGAFIMALVDTGPSAAAVRTAFGIVQEDVPV